VLAGVAVPLYSGVRHAAQESAAIHNAKLINAARDAYALTVPAAASTWGAASTDEERLSILIGENLLSGTAGEYLSMQGGYTVQLMGPVRSRTSLLYGGTPVPY
jgi:type II secretory pathway pseudopilin PulG